jgi:hypothetical protein
VLRSVALGATGGLAKVALKTLKPAFSSHAVERERFRREIQSARKVTESETEAVT